MRKDTKSLMVAQSRPLHAVKMHLDAKPTPWEWEADLFRSDLIASHIYGM